MEIYSKIFFIILIMKYFIINDNNNNNNNNNLGFILISMEHPFFQKRNSQGFFLNREITHHTVTHKSTRYNL